MKREWIIAGLIAIKYQISNPTIDIVIDSAVELLNKKGYWIEHKWAEENEGHLISNYECSNCHMWEKNDSEYCPNCGTKMENVETEMDKQEAIDILEYIKKGNISWSSYEKLHSLETFKALDMAIKALEHENIQCEECKHSKKQ